MSKTNVSPDKCKHPSSLYVVATPIGNSKDITLRAIEILRCVDVIACEDTRVTSKLLSIHDITTTTIPYHEHNAKKVRPKIIKQLQQGKSFALVSDAGTPLISDPGFKLVHECIREGINVIPIPGACAAIAAISVAGLPTDQFHFAGFPPAKSAARKTFFTELLIAPGSLIFYEAGARLAASIADMRSIFGNREAVVARELTKKFEEKCCGDLDILVKHYASVDAPKGEIVIIVAPATLTPKIDTTIIELVKIVLESKSVRDTAEIVAKVTGLPKQQVYDLALEVKK